MKVVTYTSSSGSKINVCPGCERRFRRLGEWPRDARGEEYATVSHGLHLGICDTHSGGCDTCEDSQDDA